MSSDGNGTGDALDILHRAAVSKMLSPEATRAALAVTTRLADSRRTLRSNVHTLVRRLERESGGGLIVTPNGQPRLIEHRLDELNTWQNEATTALHDLMARRSGAGPASRPLSPEADVVVARAEHRLLVGMSDNALTVSRLEASRGRWHAAAGAARESIRIRREIAAEATGTSLRPDAQAHLNLAHATFMLEGNSPRLRRELAQARTEMPMSLGLAKWLARYELMLGDYNAAFAAIKSVVKRDRVASLVDLIVDPTRESPPWLAYPCNFYTYRYSLIDDDTIAQIQLELSERASDPSATPETVARANVGRFAMRSLSLWNQANRDMANEKYRSAAANYLACRTAVLSYFAARFPVRRYSIPTTDQGVYSELVRLAHDLIRYSPSTLSVWYYFRRRYAAVTLEELHDIDWVRPTVAPKDYPIYRSAAGLMRALGELPQKIEEKVDAPLLALALVFVPLGIAESNRLRRNFDVALSECRQILRRHSDFKILSEFIERPFVKILMAQVLLEKGDAEYKARIMAASPATNPDGTLKYQGLAAAESYQGVLLNFEDQGQYVNRVKAAADALDVDSKSLLQRTFTPMLAADAQSGVVAPMLTDNERVRLRLLGKQQNIPTVVSRDRTLPGFERIVGPHEYLLRFLPPPGEASLRETNPLVYAILSEARARLIQLEAGLNFLGYRDDYVPPWRFQFLLVRARYFAEHAKNAERDYLNFLANAEREEFQESSVAQNVALEKASIRVETARVEQSRLELEAAKESVELAELVQRDAQARVAAFREYDRRADELSQEVIADAGIRTAGAVATGALSGAAAGAAVGSVIPGIGTAIGAAAGAIIGGLAGLFSSSGQEKAIATQLAVAAEQREYELFSLRLAAREAAQSAVVASAQLDAARARLMVSAMQRAGALLRHEFAVQSLQFLRNRTLNAELWYRLAHLIRGVGDRYLGYAVELAFLTEQAYEFESDKRVNIIRFDYDLSEVGGMLAADFLLVDLDTLEQDLITTQREREQQVRFVYSMAREAPETLQALRTDGTATFTITLEQLERRFPGLHNLRIGAVDVVPVAVADPTRFSLQLTHLGTSQVRLRAQPDSPPDDPSPTPLNTTDLPSWLPTLDKGWPVKARVTGPETAVFTSLTAAEREATFPFASSAQRGAFERLGAAASWRIDLSVRETRIVPGTLADIVLTFDLAGYDDSELRAAIGSAPARTTVLTQWLSGQQVFVDALYEFQNTGRMAWDVRPELLSVTERPGRLRNLAVLLVPGARRVQFGRILATHLVEFTVQPDGTLEVSTELPQVSINANHLMVDVAAVVPAGAIVAWRFGEEADWQAGPAQSHQFDRPGIFDVGLRVIRDGRLAEWHAAVVVSSNHEVRPPLAATPSLTVGMGDGSLLPAGRTRVVAQAQVPANEDVSIVWKLDRDPAGTGHTVQFDLEPGGYVLSFTAVRTLHGRFTCRQRFDPGHDFTLERLRLGTNRTFDQAGAETTAVPNVLAIHLFDTGEVGPVDRWELELPVDDNMFLRVVTPSDQEQVNLGEIDDAILSLEYETLSG
jgi:hypothetical protein